MADITLESVNAKLEKGEALSKEENKFVMALPPEDADAGNKPATDEGEEEEKIDWGAAEDLTGKDKKGEETPEEKKAKEDQAAADKKKADDEAAAAEKKKTEEEESKDPLFRIERELQKPEGQENLAEFSDREKAYFYQMRRDRKNRQKAEEERDAALFREIQHKNKDETKEEKTDEDPLAELKKKDPTDFLTVKEVVGILEKVTKPAAKKEAEPKGAAIDPVRMKYLKLCDEEARVAHPEDYESVMELTEEIVNTNPTYLKEVAKSIAAGENPAIKTYELIKSDPEFSKLFPAAENKVKARKAGEKKSEKSPEEIEKERKAQEAQDALEKNKDKTKTTGHAGGESGGADESGKIDGYSVQDIMSMSDLQFAKLPKKTRVKFLEQYG